MVCRHTGRTLMSTTLGDEDEEKAFETDVAEFHPILMQFKMTFSAVSVCCLRCNLRQVTQTYPRPWFPLVNGGSHNYSHQTLLSIKCNNVWKVFNKDWLSLFKESTVFQDPCWLLLALFILPFYFHLSNFNFNFVKYSLYMCYVPGIIEFGTSRE